MVGMVAGLPTVGGAAAATQARLDPYACESAEAGKQVPEQGPAMLDCLNDRAMRALQSAASSQDQDTRTKARKVQAALEPGDPASGALRDGRGLPAVSYLLRFDPDRFSGFAGEAVVAYGNPVMADNIVVVLAGFNSSLKNFEGLSWNARRLYAEIVRTAPSKRTSVIAWQGYDSPSYWSVVTDNSADNAAPALFDLLRTMRTWNAGANITTVGHSYGSTVVGGMLLEIPESRSLSNSIIVVGSPGMQVQNYAELNLGTVPLYVGSASRDGVVNNFSDKSLKRDPARASFGATRFKAENINRETAQNHSVYFEEKSESLFAIAEISAGNELPTDRVAQGKPRGLRLDPESAKAGNTSIKQMQHQSDILRADLVDAHYSADSALDLNGDGTPDLVVIGTDRQPTGRVSLWVYMSPADPKGRWTLERFDTQAPYPQKWDYLAVEDIDGDSEPDLIVAGTENQPGGTVNLYYYPSKKEHHLERALTTSAPYPRSWDHLVLRDMDRDGMPDLTVIGTENQVGDHVNLYFYGSRTSRGHLPELCKEGVFPSAPHVQQRITTAAPYPMAWDRITATDIDGDCRPDLLVAGTDRQSTSTINTYTYRSTLGYQQQRRPTSAPYPMPWDRVSVGDFDGDGDPDLAVFGTERQPGSLVTEWLYKSSLGYQQWRIPTLAPYPQRWDLVR